MQGKSLLSVLVVKVVIKKHCTPEVRLLLHSLIKPFIHIQICCCMIWEAVLTMVIRKVLQKPMNGKPTAWGLGLSPDSQGGQYYLLHDGRARSIQEAIQWHGGEATESINKYHDLTQAEKDILIIFLRSL